MLTGVVSLAAGCVDDLMGVMQGRVERAVRERWVRWSAEQERVLQDWQDAVVRLDAAVATEERHAFACERELTEASGALTARQRAAARRHAEAGARPVSRAARARLATWLYHADAVREVETRHATVSRGDVAAVEAARSNLAVATRDLLGTFGDRAAEITGHTLRGLSSLAAADRKD